MRTLAIVLAIGSASVGALAGAHQQPPIDSEVYLASWPGQGVAISAVTNISNDPEYDNQPSFTSDSRAVLFTSKRDGKQTDIYRYDIASKALTQLTHTPESEYSPLVTPDGKTFSVVRVEADGTQRLWRFDLDGSNPRLVLENVKPVGYHAWIDATHLALFVLGAQGQPATLQIADTMTGKAEIVATNIGRCLAVRPNTIPPQVTYVDKSDTPWTLKALDMATRKSTAIGPTFFGRLGAAPLPEDYAWDASVDRAGRLVVANFSSVTAYSLDPRDGGGPALLSISSVTNITRLAISPDAKWITFVAEPAKSAIARRP
jgi:dipeptidyl aminopeptidase/acylaminoacyl peptidase